VNNKTEIANNTVNYWPSNCLVLDTRRQGSMTTIEIVENLCHGCNGNVLLNTLVKPTRPIHAEVSNIHGITNDLVATAPSWSSVNEELAA
jgi:DNA polymerase III epsilon subunit-like protein